MDDLDLEKKVITVFGKVKKVKDLSVLDEDATELYQLGGSSDIEILARSGRDEDIFNQND